MTLTPLINYPARFLWPLTMHRTLHIVCLLSILLASSRAWAESSTQTVSEGASQLSWPWVAPSAAPEAIVTLLRWYNSAAPGALLLPYTKTLAFPDLQPYLEGLRALHCQENHLAITPRFRSSLWWPEARSERSEITFSPLRFSVEEITGITPRPSPLGEVLDVSFRWRVIGFSPLASLVKMGAIAAPPSLGATVKELEEKIGDTGSHTIPLYRGVFGYYRPMTREPLRPENRCEAPKIPPEIK